MSNCDIILSDNYHGSLSKTFQKTAGSTIFADIPVFHQLDVLIQYITVNIWISYL